MTEPQVWVLMGVFATTIFGVLTWQTITFTRTLRMSLEGVREVIEARFDAVNSKFDAVNTKIDNLDRDVQALTRHVFGSDPR